ncbi:hypothetical protein NWO25_12555 [Enterococcus lactis]|nr:hypothetical protein [Enterococcus lactis]
MGQLEPFDHSIFEIMQNNGIYCHLVTDHSHYFEDGGATYHNRYSTWEGFRGQEGDRWIPRKAGENHPQQNSLNKTGISVDQHFANRTKQCTEETMSSVQTIQAGLEFLEAYRTEDNWFLQIECFDPHEPFSFQKSTENFIKTNRQINLISGLNMDELRKILLKMT